MKKKIKKEIEEVSCSREQFLFQKGDIYENKIQQKKEIIKQLSEKLEKDIFQYRKRLPQKVLCTKLDFFFAKNRWKRMFFKVFFRKRGFFQEVQEIQIFQKGIEPVGFGALQRQSQLASESTLSSRVV